MSKVLVTGSSGFLASQLIPRLQNDGYEVIGLDNRMPEKSDFLVIKADLTRISDLEALPNVDYVFHLAAIADPKLCRKDNLLCYGVNVLGTNNILQWSVSRSVRKVCFLSSAHVYGISPKVIPSSEDSPVLLQNDPYTTSKIIGEDIMKHFYNNYHLPYLTFRLYNGFGPSQTSDYFVPKKIQEAKAGSINLIGAATTKDFIYLDDVIDALVLGLKTDFIGELNIGTGRETELREMAKKIADHYAANYTEADIQPPATRMAADTTRMKKVLGWEPKISLEEGLRRTFAWYDSQNSLGLKLDGSSP